MKLVFIFGSGAVGKMTVGQALMEKTRLRLFHNHMMIEPVLDIFGKSSWGTVDRLRNIIFEDFAKSDAYGMIFTYMFAFNEQGDWDYVEQVKSIFAPYGTEFYYVELVADKQVRKARNATPNRLAHKRSKRDIEASDALNDRLEEKYRLESLEGEIPFENYIKIDNTNLSPEEAADIIRETFCL